MPIGGSAYYDKIKKKSGQTVAPKVASAKVPTPPAVIVREAIATPVQKTVRNTSKKLVKAVRFSNRMATPISRSRSKLNSGKSAVVDPAALSEVISQILDLTQRVHSVAGQAEAAILRAEAAVLKAEIAAGKADAAGLRAETLSAKCENAVSLTEAALFKSQSSAKLADMFAGKAGLAAGKSELAAAGRNVTNVKSEAATISAAVKEFSTDTSVEAEGDNRTKKFDKPISQIAVMSMKLRTGMRQIDESNENEQTVGRPRSFASSPTFNVPVERDNLASGLISLDNDFALPRVAPFIMDDVSYDSRSREESNADAMEADARSSPTRNGVGSAA